LSSVHRLKISGHPRTLIWRSFWEKFGVAGHTLNDFMAKLEKRLGSKVVVATTIHEYRGWMSRLGRELCIFIDGYHPENYPRSYLDNYGPSIFIVRNMLDKRWFEKHGRVTIRPPSFIEKPFFLEITAPLQIRTIVLLLNHAGDWTALINRSDTDLLIREFVSTSALFPNINFIIRPHPGMIHPQHEGGNSIQRIRNFVAWSGLNNLEVSSCSLDEDFSRGDFFVSEYSQTLLDAYLMGKPGCIANFSGRRSFMEAFERYGFPALAPDEGLKEALTSILEHPSLHIIKQNIAVCNYNSSLEQFLSGMEDDELC
jgi:hypothetical protein